MHPDELTPLPVDSPTISDADLILRVREGDGAAFAQLHQRHHAAALRVARIYANSHHAAEEISAEAFARMYATLQSDAGPTENFRAYLFTVVRRIAQDVNTKASREQLTEDFSPLEYSHLSHRPVGDEFGAGMVGDAFFSLPERWRTALWYIDVEGIPTAEAATLLGLKPNATAALVYRAREGLRSAFLQQHAVAGVAAGCEPYRSKLSASVRGTLSKREQLAVSGHLATCAACSGVHEDLAHVNVRLRSVVLPLILGGSGATAFLAQNVSPDSASAAEPLRSPTGRAVRIGLPAAVLLAALVGTGVVVASRHDAPLALADTRATAVATPPAAAAAPAVAATSPTPSPSTTPTPAAPPAEPAPSSTPAAPARPALTDPPAATSAPTATPYAPAPSARVFATGSPGSRNLSISIDATVESYTFTLTASDPVVLTAPTTATNGDLTCTAPNATQLTCTLTGAAGTTSEFAIPYATSAGSRATGTITSAGSLPYQFASTLPV